MPALTAERALELRNKDFIKSGEALALVEIGDREFSIEVDRWTPIPPDQHALGLLENAARRILVDQQDEMTITFPIPPLTFYRWCHIDGNPIRLKATALEAFQKDLDGFILALGVSTIEKCFAGRVGWKEDVCEAVIELIQAGNVPHNWHSVNKRVRERSNGHIRSIDQDRIVFRTQQGFDKTVKIEGYASHIRRCIANMRHAASALQMGQGAFELRKRK